MAFAILHCELFSLIASHLPLHSAPPTLLALALTNHTYYNVTRPLLFSRVILRNEKDALNVTKTLVADPSLGNLVQELHIKSQLVEPTHDGDNLFDVVTGLMKIVKASALPNIHTLGLYLLSVRPWYMDEDFNSIMCYGQLPKDFWKVLRRKCTRLKSVMISGVGDSKKDPWLDRVGIYDLDGAEDFTSFGLVFQKWAHAKRDGPDKLLKNLHLLSSTLHTLVLGISYLNARSLPIITLRFPQLRSLTLENFENGYVEEDSLSQSMAFWRAHPLLQYLKLLYPPSDSPWFDGSQVDPELLPNLNHLQAVFRDVFALAPILHRLTSLSVDRSINAQIPYLLRSVIPGGLPLLRSLEIRQQPRWELDWISQPDGKEGALWYETEDGVFHEPDPGKIGNPRKIKAEVKRFFRPLDNEYYMHSIVKGAPNLEEISLYTDIGITPRSLLNSIGPHLAKFEHLERLYYPAMIRDDTSDEDTWALFHQTAGDLATKCKRLVLVTNILVPPMPYMAAKIRRANSGEVEEVMAVEGYGTLIGNEDNPFPKFYASEI